MAQALPPGGHQIWGTVEQESSSNNSADHSASADSTHLQRKIAMEDALKNVTFRSESGTSRSEESSEGKRPASSAQDAAAPMTDEAQRQAHENGECRPCHYVNSKFGCSNGKDCSFCHLDHEKRSRPRPCKAKRTQCKRIAGLLDTVFANDPDQYTEAMVMLSTQSGYMNTVMKSKMKNQNGGSEAVPAPQLPPQPADEAKLAALKKALLKEKSANKVSL